MGSPTDFGGKNVGHPTISSYFLGNIYIYIFHQGFQLGYRISSLISTYIYISTIEWFIRENVAGSVECLKPSSIFVGWLLRR